MSRASNSHGHDRWEGGAAAYGLGSLEEHELRPFERHLESCAQCQQDLAAMRSAVNALGTAAPSAVTPVKLKQRVLGAVRE